jgi:two-component system KDP operon response regulator KdpE
LLVRICVAVRRTERQKATPSVLTVGDMRIDLVRRRVTRAGSEVRLTPTEYASLTTLAAYPGLLTSPHS